MFQTCVTKMLISQAHSPLENLYGLTLKKLTQFDIVPINSSIPKFKYQQFNTKEIAEECDGRTPLDATVKIGYVNENVTDLKSTYNQPYDYAFLHLMASCLKKKAAFRCFNFQCTQ